MENQIHIFLDFKKIKENFKQQIILENASDFKTVMSFNFV